MRHLFLAAALLPLAAPALAAPDYAPGYDPRYERVDPALEDMTATLGDPARQQAMARAIGTMAEVVLDLPLAPILGPLAEAAGDDPRRVDPDATLRKMSPGASEVPRRLEETLPRAMGAMAGMSGALADLLPQLREATARMRDALPVAGVADLP